MRSPVKFDGGRGGRRIPASGTDLKSPKGLYSNRGFPGVCGLGEPWKDNKGGEELMKWLVECGVVAPGSVSCSGPRDPVSCRREQDQLRIKQ